jgi:hypothetical protein
LGPDFLPATGADVVARVTGPDEETQEFTLLPSLERAGRYSTNFTPGAAGEYRVDLQVEFEDGSTLEKPSYFIASFEGAELDDTRYNEELLRDIARITGGEFFHYSDLRGPLPRLPLSDGVPMRETVTSWTRSWWFLALLVGVFGFEWIWRRRIGLR